MKKKKKINIKKKKKKKVEKEFLINFSLKCGSYWIIIINKV